MRRDPDRLARAARGRVVALTLAVLALAVSGLAGCGAAEPPKRAAHRPGSTGANGSRLPAPTTPTRSTGTGVAPAGPAPLGGLHQLQVDLEHEMKLAGKGSGAYVYDLTTRTPVFSLRAAGKRPPASVEKLFTSMVALYQMGPDVRFRTTVLGHGRLSASGVWHGSLYLRGGGDPTFGSSGFNHLYELGYGPTVTQLVAQLRGAGIRRVTGRVIGDASLFDTKVGVPSGGFAADLGDLGGELSALTYDHGLSGKLTPGAFAAHALALALRADHVWALADTRTGTTPVDARPLASVSSPPLGTLLRLMNVPSDDLFAETLTKQLGVRYAGAGTTAAGAKVIASTLQASYGVHPKIVDGSGLSRRDSASPLEVVDLLRTVWRTPLGNMLWDSLPTIGVDGTVRTIATGTPAQGHCIAKTGTLDNVSNLAGYCHSAGKQVLAFALFVDGPANWQALPLEGKMVAAIARLNPASP
ncbi:MAG TPA: D-alanyl-D-alanine carboxypeptidase/D-alanyl-D-alanine-endopeptidase [Solirubrobacteraceae bacterium]|jgi:D-alanyl-D-alanine carboxypeptidase/D-alanyl-D-alanine-endopeptidase (penicillin-binding protein 4)|nr:D-alanyl-D-alanine carboxypeptidase/D-alanyl-D-alanine-endopeptidase [Solirubrobacteraceae bacterium]